MRVLCTCPPMIQTLSVVDGIEWIVPDFVQEVSQETLKELVPTCDAWVIGDELVTREMIQLGQSGKLRKMIRWGIGVNNVDVAACKELNMPFTNTPGVFNNEVADVAMGYIVCGLRELMQIHEKNRSGEWYKPRGRSLWACKVCIVGYGNIGKEIGKRAKAFGMTVVPVDPYIADTVSFNEGIRDVDVVVLSCAATPENKHLICQESLSRMKGGVYIVNVARGSLIHEDDLLAAMESGHVSGAALEVFEKEPLVKQTVQAHPRLILGSHNASNTQEGVEKTNDLVIQFLNKSI